MKQLTTTFAAVLLLGSVASPAAAEATAPPNTVSNLAFCRAFIQAVPIALGRCVSFLGTEDLNSPGFIAHMCTAFEASDPEDFYLVYDSFADCVITNHPQ